MIAFSDGDHSLFYSIQGSGTPLIFLHGFLEDSTMWDELYPGFINSHQVILIDLPCHGKSRFSGENCSMQLMADMIFKLCQYLQIESSFVVGHSMGGYVGLELSKLMDIQLLLLHSNFWADPSEKKQDRNRIIVLVKTKKNHFIQEAIPGLFAVENREKCALAIESLIERAKQIPSKEIAAATAGMRDREDNHNVMENGNVQIIHGEHDLIITNVKLEKELSHLEHQPVIYQIPNCGHMSIWEAPKALSSLIKKAIKSRN